jgi:hypothetical protein
MSSWDVVAKDLMESDEFGAQLKKDNGWLNDAVAEASPKGNAADKAKNIYTWVRDHFTCTGYNSKYLDQPLKSVLKAKSGNVAEINLLLTAMLRKADLKAYPVILSTRSHGYVNALYPLMDRFNYLVCVTEIDGKQVYLDASEPGQGFGHLGYECYNGHARIFTDKPEAIPVELDPSTIKETKNTMVFAINDEKGNFIGSVQQTPGYFESYRIRNKIKEKGKTQFEDDIRKSLGDEIKLDNIVVDSLNNYEEPVGLHYELNFQKMDEQIVYFNPLMGEGYKDNPFKSAIRFYPVEMPFAVDEVYNLQMEVPNGYVLDELPKSMLIKYNNEEDAVYEYRISHSGNTISFRSRLTIRKAYFQPEEYEVLREFFSMIVKKQSEQLVFKKKTNP